MQFTLRQMELFLAVCETGSITAAAHREHIAQSAVSTAIQNLEAVLGVTLFVRSHAVGVFPTPTARELLPHVRSLLAQATAIEQFGANNAVSLTGTVPVGILVTIAPIVMAPLIKAVEGRYPAARLQCLEGDQDQLIASLRRGEISLALTYDIAIPDDLTFWPIARIPPRVLISATDPLAQVGSLSVTELVDRPFVLLDLPGSADYFLSLFAAEGLEPRIAYRSRNIDVVRSLVAQGLGYSIVNLHALGPFPETAAIAIVPLGGSRHVLSLGSMVVAGQRPGPAALAVQDQVVAWVEKTIYSQDGNESGES